MGTSDSNIVVLYRPVGKEELNLIKESGFKKFPPRLFYQPYFYPVLNQEYAEQIARDWNTKDPVSGFAGFVTKFNIDKHFISKYQVRTVGKRLLHEELWIPAEDLEELNSKIIGKIEIVKVFDDGNE